MSLVALSLVACTILVTPPPDQIEATVSAELAKIAAATAGAAQTQAAVAAQQTLTAQPLPLTAEPAATPAPVANGAPSVTAANSAVNLRAGPGVNYDIVGVLAQGQSLEIVGRNAEASWWLAAAPDGLAWIAASVTTASNVTAGIPIAPAPPPPTPLPTPLPTPTHTLTPAPPPLPTHTPTPIPPRYQYTIRNIFGQVNEAITQIRGDIRDTNGNPVNGARVRVRSGSFCTVSFPSGPAGGYPQGVYDILLDNRAKDGLWQVAVVNGPADPKNTRCDPGLTPLSEEVTVPTNTREGVVFVEWWKNF